MSNDTRKRARLHKTSAAVALFLILTMFLPLAALPAANAHDPPRDLITYAYLNVAPDPVGVNQRVFVVVWLDSVMPGATVNNDIRRHGFKITITKPDNNIETVEWDVVEDTASSAYTLYYPDQLGEYTFNFTYSGEVYTWNQANTPGLSASNAAYENDTYLPSSKVKTLIVQEEQVPEPLSSYPLPSEYWTRPIEGQNTDWWTISSNWLGRQSPQLREEVFRNPDDGIGPTTPHVMWTRPIQDGGVVGGTNTHIEGNMYYPGLTYNRRFNNPIIMNGRLYYTEPLGVLVTTTTAGGPTVAVDLRTGETVWSKTIPGPNNIFQMGYIYTAENPNMHGAFPGILFTADFARAYDARTGAWLFNVTNVPVTRAISPTTSVGTEALGPDGTVYLYQLNMANRWLAQWNSSKLWTWTTVPRIGEVVDASTPDRYDWNVSIPSTIPVPRTRIAYTIKDDLVLLTNITTATGFGPSAFGTQPYMVAAINLNASRPGYDVGELLWMEEYEQPPLTRSIPGKLVDEENRVFMAYDKETSQIHGYSLDNGHELWTTTLPADSSDFILYSYLGAIGLATAYGRVYFGGYGGILHAYNVTNGKLLWTYGNGGEGNTTYSGTALAYGRYPIYPGPIANGVIYLDTGEHSANTPLYKGALVRALNATTGEEIWTLSGWGGHHRREGFAVADGYLVFLNHYDYQIYSIGRGPSATTVTASPKVSVQGSSVLIEGTVMDIAAGTKQNEQAARFPYGVPAVSDASMSEWMEYIYMQKPRPTDAVGVDVTLSVLDSNGNYRDIGTATSNSDGFFHYTWTPDIPGDFTVYASFEGSEGYWPSHAVTAFTVDTPADPTAPPSPTPAPMTDMYVLGSAIGIIIAIVAVGLILILMLRKR